MEQRKADAKCGVRKWEAVGRKNPYKYDSPSGDVNCGEWRKRTGSFRGEGRKRYEKGF